MQALFRKVCGVDVHKENIVASVVWEENRERKHETREFGTMQGHLEGLKEWLDSMGVELVVMESTAIYWVPVYECLEAGNYRISLVNALHVKKVPGRKTDVSDSIWLAELGMYGLVRGSFIPEPTIREIRALTRRYLRLKDEIAKEKNRLNQVLEESGIKLSVVVSDVHGVYSGRIIDALIDGKDVEQELRGIKGRLKGKVEKLREAVRGNITRSRRIVMRSIREHMKHLEEQLKEIWEEIESMLKAYDEEYKLLQTIPGISGIIAAFIIGEIGVDMSRFESKFHLASWSGLCPGNNESGGKRRSGRTRRGNKVIKRMMCEAANAAVKTESQFQKKYKGLVIRRGHKRSIVAIGHKLIKTAYVVLKQKEPYNDKLVDYERLVVKRNAPRWIRKLKEYGYISASGKLQKAA